MDRRFGSSTPSIGFQAPSGQPGNPAPASGSCGPTESNHFHLEPTYQYNFYFGSSGNYNLNFTGDGLPGIRHQQAPPMERQLRIEQQREQRQQIQIQHSPQPSPGSQGQNNLLPIQNCSNLTNSRIATYNTSANEEAIFKNGEKIGNDEEEIQEYRLNYSNFEEDEDEDEEIEDDDDDAFEPRHRGLYARK